MARLLTNEALARRDELVALLLRQLGPTLALTPTLSIVPVSVASVSLIIPIISRRSSLIRSTSLIAPLVPTTSTASMTTSIRQPFGMSNCSAM